jgi:hypothetical protein
VVELRHPEELRRWLEMQNREVVIAMGARAALRMIPLLVSATNPESSEAGIIPKVLFANSVSWVVAQFPERQLELRQTAFAARDAARRAVQATNSFAPGAPAAAANSAENAARAASRTTKNRLIIAADVLRALDTSPEVFADANMVEGGITFHDGTILSIKLAGSPLYLAHIPDQVAQTWAALKRGLERANQGRSAAARPRDGAEAEGY